MDIARTVADAIARQPITDTHTHCYPPAFGASPEPDALLLWGIDELVTYHYLVAEVFRVVPARAPHGATLPYERFWQMPKSLQADHIWKNLFVERTPLGEACRGVLTTLKALGLDPNERTLEPYRRWFAAQDPDKYIDRVMELANVDSITMTNAIFDPVEHARWAADPDVGRDPRFEAVLRIDPLLRTWPAAAERLTAWGYEATPDLADGQKTVDAVRRFLVDWIERMRPLYVAMSLPPAFAYPDPANPLGDRFIRDCLMPVCRDHGLPWALMIGCRLGVNPALADAGDMVAKADIGAVVNLCADFPENRFLVTMLSRENQHELCVAARKFGNLMPFGCWWFLNNPSIVREITRERLELLGTSFIPQHSDARVLDQLIYKWRHSRRVIAAVLTEKYDELAATGFELTADHVRRDVARLMRDNFRRFVGR